MKTETETVITIGVGHIKRIDLASNRSIRRMVHKAVTVACDKARALGAKPITAVDDLTIHSMGPWIDNFAKYLARSAMLEGISISGGEMAQMADTYAYGYVGVVVFVLSLK